MVSEPAGLTRTERLCASCGNTFFATAVMLGDRLMSTARNCDPCAHAIEEEKRTAAQVLLDAKATRNREQAVLLLNTPPLFATHTMGGVGTTLPLVHALLSDLELHGSAEQQRSLGRALQLARRLVGELSGGLRPAPFSAFIGGPGTGKTFLLWAIAGELASRHGIRSRVVRLSTLVRDLRASWRDKDGPSEDARLASYIDVPFLGIDEVSRHAFYGQQIHQHLYDVINARLEHDRPTLLTSNEDEAGLASILGIALTDRLVTGGIVDFGTGSYRRAGGGAS